MKLLIVTQYFWPEFFIINDLAKVLVRQGHEIHVLTGHPNYPDGQLYEGYEKNSYFNESYENAIKVFRVPLRPRHSGGTLNLVRNYLSFIFNGLLCARKATSGENYDAILVFAPSPITSAVPAIYLRWLKKAHLAIWVQDLWPESLSATGFIKNKSILKLVGVMVRWIYRCSDTLLIQSEAFHKPVAAYAAEEKIHYYPNSMLRPVAQPAEPELPEMLMGTLNNSFSVVFAGNMGKAQALDTVLHAAKLLQHIAEIKFILVGAGSEAVALQQQADELGLDNVIFTGRFAADKMPAIYSRSEALLVMLKDEEIFRHTVPSKVQAYLMAGKPIIAAINGEAARVIDVAEAGITCEAENHVALAAAVEKLYLSDSEERKRMGDNGLSFFMQHFEMERQAQQLTELLQKRLDKDRMQ